MYAVRKDDKVKKCRKCNKEMKLKDFYKGKCVCKKCLNKKKQEKNRTKKGLVSLIYSNQKSNSKKRGHNLPTYTKKELEEWLYAQPKFHLLYNNWKRLDFQKDYVPSVDRIDDNIGYTMANIQLMTWKENNEKGFKARKNGDNTKVSKAVLQYDKDGNFIDRFYSQQKASKETGVSRQQIGQCCLKKQKTAGGFVWKFEE